MGVRAAWSGADPQLLANIRFLAGYRRPALIEAGLILGVLDAAAGQSSAGAIERALWPRCPPLLVRPVSHLLWTGRIRAGPARPLSAGTPVTWTVPDLISLIAAHHATGPRAETNVPVGPPGAICAIRTMTAAPSSTVWVPVRPLRSVLV